MQGFSVISLLIQFYTLSVRSWDLRGNMNFSRAMTLELSLDTFYFWSAERKLNNSYPLQTDSLLNRFQKRILDNKFFFSTLADIGKAASISSLLSVTIHFSRNLLSSLFPILMLVVSS